MSTSITQPLFFDFRPLYPSPLSMCDANARHRTRSFHPHMASPQNDFSKPSFPKRQSKYTTLIKDINKQREQRQEIFLKKVKQRTEDQRWEVRGEQNLRLDFITRQKQWEEEQARRAKEEIPEVTEDDETDRENVHRDPEVDMFEEFLSQEDQELEARLELLEDKPSGYDGEETVMTDYDSDDDEYDRLLLEAARQVEEQGRSNNAMIYSQEDQEMDYSME